MVDRDYHGEYLNKYIKNNLIPLVICFEAWNLIWFLLGKVPWLLPGGGGLPATASTTLKAALFVGKLFVGNTGSALWYLPMCIGLYLGMPIISRLFCWASEKRNNIYLTILIISLLYFGTLVPTLSGYASSLNMLSPVTPVISLNIFNVTVWGDSVWMIYLAAGFAIKRGWLSKLSTQKLTICFVFVILLMIISKTALQSLGGGYANFFVCSSGILLFALLDRLEPRLEDSSSKIRAIWNSLAHYSFPIYMIHLWVTGGLGALLAVSGVSQEQIVELAPLVALLVCLLLIIIIMLVSSLVAKILSRVPLARRWLLLWKN